MTTAPVATPSPSRTARPARPIVHSGESVQRYFAQHFQGAVFPLAAGLLLYGWRALLVCTIVIAFTAGGSAIWQRIGRRGRDLSMAHACWAGLLLSLTLPPHLGVLDFHPSTGAFWLLAAAGSLLAIVLWGLRGMAGTAVHPVIVTYLLLVPFFESTLVPHYVLQRDKMFVGNVLDASRTSPVGTTPWWEMRAPMPGHDALRIESPASESLLNYTLGRRASPDRGVTLLQSLLRDRLPPLEDLVMAGNPGPIGSSSIAFVVIGGLFMLYRGVIDYRIPLLIVLVAYAAMLVLPIPVTVTNSGPRLAWLAMRQPSVGSAVAFTFVHYQLAASPAVFMAFFLATSPGVRPLTRRGRAVFAILIGLLTAIGQLYISVSWGPYAALFIAGLLTPALDWIFKPRPLI